MDRNWTYKLDFGVVHVETWGDPFLVLAENKYFGGEHWGYNYWNLETTFPDKETAAKTAKVLNERYNLPKTFSSDDSETFLLQVQILFPNAKIAAS